MADESTVVAVVAADDAKSSDGKSKTYTVLRALDHDLKLHLPGDTLSLSDADAAELVATRVVAAGTGKEAKAALETAEKAPDPARLGG